MLIYIGAANTSGMKFSEIDDAVEELRAMMEDAEKDGKMIFDLTVDTE